MDKDLEQLVEKLKSAAGVNLSSVVLYGSAASGHFHPKHSDLNVLCVLGKLDPESLEALGPVARWWTGKGQPPFLLFTMDELRCSADVFAIELLDIKAAHRVLHGADCFSGFEVPMDLHRLQVERELRTKLIRLRQAYIASAGDPKRVLELLTKAVSSFLTLFRHSLIVFGEQSPQDRHAMLDALAARLSLDAAPFHTVLEVREGKRNIASAEVTPLARAYIQAVTRVADEVDRCVVK